MKYMIISDIHGSKSFTEHVLNVFEHEHCDKLIILGDILYHGPRNPLPIGHDPQGVVSLLNAYASQIIAVRGNCEAEVDQMLLDFPCLSDYALIVDNGTTLFATHGHIYSETNLPKLHAGDFFFYGHTHLWVSKVQDGLNICNPGSISLPKENRPATYAIYENNKVHIYTLDGQLLA
ncbi:MAG: phosphodiesterase [Cellulosilyticaceae bacterium]